MYIQRASTSTAVFAHYTCVLVVMGFRTAGQPISTINKRQLTRMHQHSLVSISVSYTLFTVCVPVGAGRILVSKKTQREAFHITCLQFSRIRCRYYDCLHEYDFLWIIEMRMLNSWRCAVELLICYRCSVLWGGSGPERQIIDHQAFTLSYSAHRLRSVRKKISPDEHAGVRNFSGLFYNVMTHAEVYAVMTSLLKLCRRNNVLFARPNIHKGRDGVSRLSTYRPETALYRGCPKLGMSSYLCG